MDKAIEERDAIILFTHLYADAGGLPSDPRCEALLKKSDLPRGL
jgi:hypothetical protein